jgi:hypothetical protein
MRLINVQSTATQVAAPGNYDFIHIYNDSDVPIYLSYDGAQPTVGAGMTLLPMGWFALESDGLGKNLFSMGVYAIHGSVGDKQIRIQGI